MAGCSYLYSLKVCKALFFKEYIWQVVFVQERHSKGNENTSVFTPFFEKKTLDK